MVLDDGGGVSCLECFLISGTFTSATVRLLQKEVVTPDHLLPSSPDAATITEFSSEDNYGGDTSISNLQDDQPVNVGGRNKRSSRRYARDVSYDGEQRVRDLLKRLDGHDGHLGTRMPIDRIDEPVDWTGVNVISRREQPLDRLHQSSPSWSTFIIQPLDRLALPVLYRGGMQWRRNRFKRELPDGRSKEASLPK